MFEQSVVMVPPLPPKTKHLSPLSEQMDRYCLESLADSGSPDGVAVTGSNSSFTEAGCSSRSSTVFVAAPSGGIPPRPEPESTVNTAPRNGHVVTIRINTNNESKVSLNRQEPINTIGKFIVNICESSEPQKHKPITISVNTEDKEMVQKSGSDMSSPYFFCNPFPSSGQCSPSDTLDSGTCSDLDGTPPPLPKKKLSHKRVSVTVIGSTHERAPSVASSGAEVDSEDSESNISCDSLNSSDLSTASLHDDSGVITFKPKDTEPEMPALIPQGLLKDIRDRSAKLSSVEIKTSWAELDKKEVEEPKPKIEEKLTSFKLVSQINKPIIVDTTPAYHPAKPIINESTYEDRKQEKQKQDKNNYNFLYDTDKYYNFHMNENVFDNEPSVVKVLCKDASECEQFDEAEYFAGFKDYKNEDAPSTIRSAKGTIRGVKNRVRAGIKTFLQMQDTSAKSYREKDAGKVVVYTTSMGIVRGTYQKCVQVKKILRTLLVKFEERDVFMSGEYQEEIKDRMRSSDVLVPQIFVDGQHVGDGETIERLNECGELRRMLKPYKSADACNTCQMCGGYRLLPCPVCSGSKKSVHRNHFTAEFVALKCMNCDEVGLVKCEAC